ncbi:uncharacterized protein PV06_09953 [Exophiala oligosperma]|uniref:DUF1279 domain-containing protein n=1 Tax=Exophiala oligosperma TaxID=215243 RepID=A0A0D2ACI4_9EURO|nr:uncharacterized protein PV06_09953 [Exophiala oligosperma]KIW37976.1 hypothetical protein PV06_09953 [Exophiala oligosperma]
MNSMRVLERNALQQLLHVRPAASRRALIQFEQRFGQSILQQSLQTRSLQTSVRDHTRRGIHTQRSATTFSSPGPRSGSFATQNARNGGGRIPCPGSRTQQQGKRWNSGSNTSSSSGSSGSASTEKLSFSQRMKKLSREYGWAALGVYLALTALDFPFCFLAVRMLGTDRIGHWEHVALSWIRGVVAWPFPQKQKEVLEAAGDVVEANVVGETKRILEEEGPDQQSQEVEDHGYKEAEKANTGSNASIWTQLALAYAIHKSFIFVRVPLTAGITPKVVKTLRGWGWNIGKMPKKGVSGSSASSSSSSSSGTAGVNTKGSKVKGDD